MAATTTQCPLRCPAGWQQLPNTGTDHCYLLPPKPVPQAPFWDYQNYCKSAQPTSYIVCVNSRQEHEGGAVKAMNYLLTYVVGTFYLWLGAYYENGSFHWLDGSPWNYSGMPPNLVSQPTDGSCVFIDPRTTAGLWSFRPCNDPDGSTVCEMSPLPDCSGTTLAETTPAPYADPDCNEKRMTDFLRQQQNGYLGISEMITLTGKDVQSCAVACMYYSGCLSFDISIDGDCRLLSSNTMAMCASFVADDNYQHYDMAMMSA